MSSRNLPVLASPFGGLPIASRDERALIKGLRSLQAETFGELARTQAIEAVELRKAQAIGEVAKGAVDVAGQLAAECRRVVEQEPAAAPIAVNLLKTAGNALDERIRVLNQRLG